MPWLIFEKGGMAGVNNAAKNYLSESEYRLERQHIVVTRLNSLLCKPRKILKKIAKNGIFFSFRENPQTWVPFFWRNYPWTWVRVPSCRRHIPNRSKSENTRGSALLCFNFSIFFNKMENRVFYCLNILKTLAWLYFVVDMLIWCNSQHIFAKKVFFQELKDLGLLTC